MTFTVGFVTGATPDKWARVWRERSRERLELVPVDEDAQFDGVRDGSQSMALVRLPVDRDDLHLIPLYDELPVVVMSIDNTLTLLDEVTLADLADEHQDWGDLGMGDVVATVAAGTGVVVAPMSVARLHHRKDLTHRTVTDLPPTTVGLAWRVDDEDERVQAFIGIVRGRSERRLAVRFVDAGAPRHYAESVRAGFADHYGVGPSAVGRAPGRVNLMGEHTDYNNGLVLPVAPHAAYAAARLRDDSADAVVRVASVQQAEPWEGPLSAIGPGTVDGWAAYAAGVVWALHEAGHEIPGVDLFVDSTVPLGAGLSSSAALECSVGLAVATALGLPLTPGLRHDLVAAGMRAETEVVGAPTGGMDQTVAMLGEAGAALLIDFDRPADQGRSTPVPLALDGHTLLVTDTRASHALVDGGYGQRRKDCEEAVAALGVPSLRQADLEAVSSLEDERVRRRATHVVTEIGRVRDCVDALASDDLALGALFAASHASMRDDFEISCPELDVAVAVAVEAGAVAARMTGGGFGGSSVAVVAEDRVRAVTRAIDTAFALKGFAAPGHLRAEPSTGATVER